jgi:charged multivesicular body protein 2A
MSEAMKGATKAMASMNRRMNLPQIQKIMMDFERESEFMDMKEEMMNDAIDDAVEEEDDEAETNEIVDRVLDEIGIDMNQQVSCQVWRRRGKSAEAKKLMWPMRLPIP